MNRRYILLLGLLLPALQSISQMYILNEDFSGASGTTPPAGWNNIVISGSATDQWHFDNPGNRIINYPVTEPFAIFDSDSTSANGQPEQVALETPLFDASTSNYILLNFAHTFDPGTGGTGKVEAYDGSAWHEVITYTIATTNPDVEMLDLSAYTGGITNAKVRFTWSGIGSGYWALDNIRIYASLPLDGGVVSIDSPESPVVPGVQNVIITLGNFGYNTISSSRIDWTANGVPQATFNWNGALGFGETVSGIVIGTYNFQEPVMVKVWQSLPNGQADLNPYNDTISEYLVAALCGTYTIGGSNPDFETFSQAADVLNIAGVTCPVTFLVRDGIYYEQFLLRNIPGTSATNTVTFRSESGDSTLAVIRIPPAASKYESMIILDGSQFVNFEQLGLHTGSAVSYANNALQLNGARNIIIEGCSFEVKNQSDFGIALKEGSQDIEIDNSHFLSISPKAGAITIADANTSGINITGNTITGATDSGSPTIRIGNNTGNVNITGNLLDRCNRPIYSLVADSISITGNVITNSNEGVYIDDYSSYVLIAGNRITGIKSQANVVGGTSAISVSKASHTQIYNNYIQTTGDGLVNGITLEEALTCGVFFNSVNITNIDSHGSSSGIRLLGINEVTARNNIFNVTHAGTPVYIDEYQPLLDFDRNDYYSMDQSIGYYNGNIYSDLTIWSDSLGMDAGSLSVIPFFTSLTDLSINQALLNNAAVPVAGITIDIDNSPRNPSNPDIGAKEYDPCQVDAGINAFASPGNPLNGGMQEVSVILQNQGTNALSGATINWKVNDVLQASYPWSGNLAAGANIEVPIGNYDFQQSIVYTLQAWTSGPNGNPDCNNYNDTISSRQLAAPLCGTYTIGGASPDFSSFSDAVTLLNLAGVTCPVVFLVRDGTYNEKLVITSIQGTSEINTVTFLSESGDSTKVLVQIDPSALKYESTIYIEGSQHINFQYLGFLTGSLTGSFNNALLLQGAKNIEFSRCYFESKKESDLGIGIQGGSENIDISFSRFECSNYRAGAINMDGVQTRAVNIEGNIINGATDWGYTTIRVGNGVRNVNINGNHLDSCYRAIYLVSMDTALIRGNVITNSNDGIYADDWCAHVEISGNRLINMQSHQNAPEGTNGIIADNVSQVDIFNNFVHTTGDGPALGISLQNTTQGRVNFNSINITNTDNQGKSRGLILKGGSGVTSGNNIVNMTYLGIPVYIATNIPQLAMDHNDYYSYDQSIGYYNGNLYTELSTWSDSLNMDMNSFSAPPFFSSPTDPSMNQALLNNSAAPVAGITVDIDGTPRDPVNPDIGVREYSLCASDAGINAVISPVNPLSGGSAEVRVILQNQGTSALSGVKINWMVNGNLQAPFAWSGNLAGSANIEVSLGNYDFPDGNSYIIKAWTSEPNNSADCNHKNDTIYSQELAAPLCGTFKIGGINPDFTTFAQAVNVMNSAGISCPVTFLVRDGLYIEKFILGDIKGSSEVNTITFRSESGDSSLAVVQIDPGALKYDAMIYLDGSQHVIFEGLGLFTGSEAGNANYSVLCEDTRDIEFTGCYFKVVNESDYGLVVLGGSQGVNISHNRFESTDFRAGAINISDGLTQDIDIIGNIIKGSSSWGYTLVKLGNETRRINVKDNSIERCYRSLYMVGADSISVTGNVIKNCNDGIYVDNLCSNIDISRNRLTNIHSHQNAPEGTTGIFVQNSIGISIINNFVETAGDGPVLGMKLINSDSCSIIYNSVNITNNDAQGKSKGIYLKSSSQIHARNNIYSIKNLGLPIHIDIDVTDFSLDYNDYFNPAGIVGKVNDEVFTSLSQWGQTINCDANSKVVNPYFKADTIPLPFQRVLNGAGIPIPGILYDIDGKLRYFQAPDIGCIEFFVDYGILDLLSPTLNCFHTSMDSVTVYIRQYGDVPFNDLKIAYSLNNGPVHIDTIPGPLLTDVIHTFGTTENISAPGDYQFRIWLINTLDDNINNDTLVAMRYSKPPPVVTMVYDNFCTGWEVHFTGQATVEAPYFIDHFEWLFGDGESSTEQNPVHLYAVAGAYDVTCRAYSSAGCYSEITEAVNLDPDFQGLNLGYDLTNETCPGDSTGVLELMAFGGYPPYNYFLNGSQVTDSLIRYFTPGKYEIRVVDSQNCTRTDSVESSSIVHMGPKITADPISGYTPLTVSFDFTADSAASWIWHFTETDSSTNKSAEFTFQDYGDQTVILEVHSGPPYFCTEYDSIIIFVDLIVTIDINSVFTPNNDGYNDFFEVKTTGVKDLNVKIFNQWGNKMYEIEKVDQRWDGNTTGGAEAPDGTYFYSVTATGYDELIYDRKGSVLLLRHGSEAFPNPATDKVKIKIYDPLEPPVTVSVYSVFGQLACTEILDDPANLVIDISQLTGGIYILKVNDGRRNYFARFIKN